MNEYAVLGLDTSNYTCSAAYFDTHTGELRQAKQLLPVKSGEKGIRQEIGVFCETAHPAKFKEKVDNILGIDIDIPERLAAFMKGEKQSISMSKDFADFKAYLMEQ